jgi:hypothetical protein
MAGQWFEWSLTAAPKPRVAIEIRYTLPYLLGDPALVPVESG